jgi:hypothetical protein
MKKSSIIYVMLSLALNISAQNITINASSMDALPSFKWLTDSVLSMGQLELNKPAKVIFEFENRGNAPLLITKVEPSCGCTSVEYSKEPVTPGAKGFVQTIYNASSLGIFSKSLIVYANTPDRSRILTIKGEVVQKK